MSIEASGLPPDAWKLRCSHTQHGFKCAADKGSTLRKGWGDGIILGLYLQRNLQGTPLGSSR